MNQNVQLLRDQRISAMQLIGIGFFPSLMFNESAIRFPLYNLANLQPVKSKTYSITPWLDCLLIWFDIYSESDYYSPNQDGYPQHFIAFFFFRLVIFDSAIIIMG